MTFRDKPSICELPFARTPECFKGMSEREMRSIGRSLLGEVPRSVVVEVLRLLEPYADSDSLCAARAALVDS